MNYQLLEGDCLEVMKTLPANSVQCCVTSPPYYGLRDYGTAEWEGGDPSCDHKPSSTPAQRGIATSTLSGGQGTNGHQREGYKDTCPRCGARRIDRQIGLEDSPESYVAKLVDVFREVRRLLHPSGVLFLNLGDSYAGSGKGGQSDEKRSANWQPTYANKGALFGLKPKDLIGIPWMVAFALRADGWWLRSEIIWHKRAPMPESVTDRPTKAHEQVFLLAKSANYFYDADAIREEHQGDSGWAKQRAKGINTWDYGRAGYQAQRIGGMSGMETGEHPNGRNKRTVWTLGPEQFKGSHFATMPTKLVEPCILAGSRPGDTVLDPFNGAATTGIVAIKHGRNYVGIDLNPDYLELSRKRLAQVQPMLLEAAL